MHIRWELYFGRQGDSTPWKTCSIRLFDRKAQVWRLDGVFAPGTSVSVHLGASAKASSAVQLLFMMTPYQDPVFGFSFCPIAERPNTKKNIIPRIRDRFVMLYSSLRKLPISTLAACDKPTRLAFLKSNSVRPAARSCFHQTQYSHGQINKCI